MKYFEILKPYLIIIILFIYVIVIGNGKSVDQSLFYEVIIRPIKSTRFKTDFQIKISLFNNCLNFGLDLLFSIHLNVSFLCKLFNFSAIFIDCFADYIIYLSGTSRLLSI